MVGVRDYCGSQGMQLERREALSTGIGGEGWGVETFLDRNVSKMTVIKAKQGNLNEETADHHACPWA